MTSCDSGSARSMRQGSRLIVASLAALISVGASSRSLAARAWHIKI